MTQQVNIAFCLLLSTFYTIFDFKIIGSALAYCCYELSKNQDVQEKLREEIEDICDNPDQELSYDQVQSLPYLDQVISETLRFHTPIGMLQRSASKDYVFPNTGLKVEKDDDVWINVMLVHFNPEYYETPYKFNPEHFSKEAKAKRHP